MNTCSDNLKQHRHESTAQFLLEAAEAVLVRKGYDRVTMRDIAAQAGCAPGTLYLYFKHKQDVLDAITARHSRTLLAQVNAALATAEKPAVRLRRMLQLLIAYTHAQRSIIRVLYTGQAIGPGGPPHMALPGDLPEQWNRFFASELAVVREAQAAGQLRADCPPESILTFLTFVLLGVRDEVVSGGALAAPEQQADMVWDFLTHGLGGTGKERHAKR